ncbi:alpha/beta hydrolase family esterase [Catenuloplanes sp. NPDC051500]|uniref:alpha/beta hydrolase family esterase n=1 Tax=Catenuloplanes sp. NPDC051500 TaxID=3363959 RepID=UPI00378CCB89
MTERSIDAGGRTRTYTIITPDGGFDRLLLVFHGSMQTASSHRAFTGNAFDTVKGAAVVYLNGFKGNWNDARLRNTFPARTRDIDDVAFAEAVIAREAGGRPVYAAGYSNGGGMVIRLLHERPGLLAGATIIAAGQPVPDNLVPTGGAAAVPTPVLIVHGTRDPIVRYTGGEMATWARLVFRAGGALLSAPDTAAYFAARNGITAAPSTVDLTAELSRTDFRQDGHPPVTLYTVQGGGHTIPGPVPSPRLMGHTTCHLHTADAIAEFFAF